MPLLTLVLMLWLGLNLVVAIFAVVAALPIRRPRTQALVVALPAVAAPRRVRGTGG